MKQKVNPSGLTKAQILKRLKSQGNPDNLAGMARYGMNIDKRLGVSMPEIRRLAKEVGRDHALAMELWETGIAEARILAAMVADPQQLTAAEMEAWVKDFDSWDVCDQVCMNLFDKSPLARAKILAWSRREQEYVKRAAFATIACIAWHDKDAPDDTFIEYLGIIKQGATDERNYVRKANNWALRVIGKRNARLNKAALKTARELQRMDSKAAKWNATDAIKELESQSIQKRFFN